MFLLSWLVELFSGMWDWFSGLFGSESDTAGSAVSSIDTSAGDVLDQSVVDGSSATPDTDSAEQSISAIDTEAATDEATADASRQGVEVPDETDPNPGIDPATGVPTQTTDQGDTTQSQTTSGGSATPGTIDKMVSKWTGKDVGDVIAGVGTGVAVGTTGVAVSNGISKSNLFSNPWVWGAIAALGLLIVMK